jgi:hypothetical protein
MFGNDNINGPVAPLGFGADLLKNNSLCISHATPGNDHFQCPAKDVVVINSYVSEVFTVKVAHLVNALLQSVGQTLLLVISRSI